MQHVFVSYKHEDAYFAELVIEKLEKKGFVTWADSNIGAGEEWRNSIDLAIKNSFALIVIMTPEAKSSEYVTYEWAFAWGAGVRVIPVMLKLTELHPRLEALQYLDFTNQRSGPWGKLMEEVRAASNTPLTHSVNIPLNSPPFIRQAVASLDSAVASDRKGAIDTLEIARTPEADTILRQALRHPLPDVRINAAVVLGRIADPAAVQPLNEALKDPESTVRRAATRALQSIADPAAVQPLNEALKDYDSDVRRAAAEALQSIADPAAVQPLIEALKDRDSDVRYAAAEALGGIADPAAVQPLIEALKDPEREVRYAAAGALGKIADPAAVRPLNEALKDPEREVRYAATEALREIAGAAAVQPS